MERGLGSSAAAIAGGLVAANLLCDKLFNDDELLEMAATIEGHPDNVVAAIHGGLQLVVADQDRLYAAPINVPPELTAVLFIPDFRIATVDARAVLPEKVSIKDAVYNMSRVALLLTGMATNRPEYFGLATQDRLHQPYRQPLFPAMEFTVQGCAGCGGPGSLSFRQWLNGTGVDPGPGDDRLL